MMYKIYGFTGCEWCEKAKQFAQDVDLDYEAIMIETREERNAFLDERGIESPNRTWPRVFEVSEGGTERMIGGYRQLLEKFMPV